MFYHIVQSFPKGAAVDPRQAHEVARWLAEYFEGCEVLACTHVNCEHIHSRCIGALIRGRVNPLSKRQT